MIIKIDISNVFNTTCRALTLDLTLDVLSGRVSRDYACGLKKGQATPTCEHLSKGKTDGQQGDPLEMFIFNLTIHHLRGRVLAKFQESRAIAYTDDGYIKVKLSVTLQVLAELNRVLKEDGGLELNVSKTSILLKGTTHQAVIDVEHIIITVSPALTQLSGDVSLTSFCPEGFVGNGVSIGTDDFVQNFVAKTCSLL